MEEGGGADQVRPGLERDTALGLGVLQVVNRGEMAVGKRGVGERPQVFGGLKLGRVGGQKEQVHMVGDAQVDAGVPAGPVEHQHNLLAGSGADLAGECGEFHLKERDADGGGQMEDGAT